MMNSELNELDGYAGFTIRLELDTEEIHCVRCIVQDITSFLEDVHITGGDEEISDSQINHYKHILEKLEGIVEKADKSFTGK